MMSNQMSEERLQDVVRQAFSALANYEVVLYELAELIGGCEDTFGELQEQRVLLTSIRSNPREYLV